MYITYYYQAFEIVYFTTMPYVGKRMMFFVVTFSVKKVRFTVIWLRFT